MIDDATAAYIVENQKCFEDLKQVASQLAGLLVLAAAGSKEAAPDHPVIEAARELFREASDELRRVHPTERARRHHDHLALAAASIRIALKEAGAGLNVDRILIPLRAGYTELERAADALPGFEKVSYERACCGGGLVR
jgi:predicted component of type VI protein secretion system